MNIKRIAVLLVVLLVLDLFHEADARRRYRARRVRSRRVRRGNFGRGVRTALGLVGAAVVAGAATRAITGGRRYQQPYVAPVGVGGTVYNNGFNGGFGGGSVHHHSETHVQNPATVFHQQYRTQSQPVASSSYHSYQSQSPMYRTQQTPVMSSSSHYQTQYQSPTQYRPQQTPVVRSSHSSQSYQYQSPMFRY